MGNPQDVYVVTTRPTTQRAVLEFARYVGCNAIAGRFTPGAFTNQIQTAFREPRLLLITDPRADHQPVTESQMVKAPDFVAPDKEDWGADAAVTDWAADGQPAAAPVAAPAAIVAPGAAAPVASYQVTEDWAAQTETSDWAAASANPAETQQGNSWGGSTQW